MKKKKSFGGKGDFKKLKQCFLKGKISCNWEDSQGHSLLSLAIARGDLKFVKLLLDQGALICISNSKSFKKTIPWRDVIKHEKIHSLILNTLFEGRVS